MKDINLLPRIEKKRKKGFLFFNFFLAVALILLITVAGFSFFTLETKKELEKKLDIIKKTNFDLNLHKEKLLYYQDFEQQVNKKSELIKNININTIKWSRKLYELSERLPEKIYIVNFNGRCDNLYSSVHTVKEGNAIPKGRLLAFSMEGYAEDYIDISKLILAIKGMTDVSEPWIATIRETEVQNLKLLYFKVEAFWNIDNFINDIKSNKKEPSGNIRNLSIDDI